MSVEEMMTSLGEYAHMNLEHPTNDLEEDCKSRGHPQDRYSSDLDLGIFSKSLIKVSLLVNGDLHLEAYYTQLRLLGDR